MEELLDQIVRFGIPFVALSVFVEQIGLPLPAVPVLVLAGALSADGRVPGAAAFASAVLASVLADSIWFALGRRHGPSVLKTVCRISVSPDSCVKRMESLYAGLGLPSLLFAKWVPGFSTVAPPLAGALRASWVGFLFWDFAGSAAWAGIAMGAGALFHRAVDRVLAVLENLGSLGVWLLVLGLVGYVGWRYYERRRFMKDLRLARITVDELKSRLAGVDLPLIVD